MPAAWADAAYLLVIAVLTLNVLPRPPIAPWEWVTFAVVAPAVVAGVLMRRRYPLMLVSVAVVLTLAGTDAVVPVGVFVAALRSRGWRVWVATGASVAAIAARALWEWKPGRVGLDEVLTDITGTTIIAVLAPLLAGAYLRARRELESALRERAELAELERELRAMRAVQEERARIAEEMHDSLGHTLALLTTQAGALQVAAGDARTAGLADQIRQTARTGLGDLRTVVRALGEQDGSREPVAPGLAGLDALVATNEASGAATTLRVDLTGAQEPPAAVGRVLYGVVQEALTNAHRHAPGAAVAVSLVGAPGAGLTCTVTNPVGPGARRGRVPGWIANADESACWVVHFEVSSSRGVFQLVAQLPWEVPGP